MKYDILEEIGLTKSEIKVYTAILTLGETKVGRIIKLSQVSSSNVHDCLDKLIHKGVISFILKNNIKHFYSKPENLKELIKTQRNELDKKEELLNSIIPQLNTLSNKDIITQSAEIFIGFSGIKNAYKKLFDPFVKGKKSLFFYRVDENTVETVHQFYRKLDIEKDYLNIPSRGVCNETYRKYFNQRSSHVKIKYTNLPIPSSVNMYKDKTLFISWSEKPIAFLIKSEEITRTFVKLFEEIWNL